MGSNALSDFIEVELKGKVNWSLRKGARKKVSCNELQPI
jgi:hypothetical protein